MVFAMGSIAALTSADTIHIVFYQKAKKHLGLDAVGSGRMETIQGLALMAGFYLHYCNRPNMAVALTGATLRMAFALGIHREPPEQIQTVGLQNDREIRRRTWWSLVCLDIWGSTTLGRPLACEYFGPAISVKPPSFDNTDARTFADKGPYLTASVQFCRHAADIQEKLAVSSYLDPVEIAPIDAKLVNWFESLPPPLRSPHNCAKSLLVPRAILKWRYQNIRLLLYRPTLLHAALSRRTMAALTVAEQNAVQMCQLIAGDSIVDIVSDWQPDHICGWNAVWSVDPPCHPRTQSSLADRFLSQAATVPLLSLFYANDNIAESGKWRAQVEMALRILQSMELWSAVAKRCREVIAEVYEASQKMSRDVMNGAMQQWDQQSPFIPYEELWNTGMWDQVWQYPEFPFGPTEFVDYPSISERIS
ncbi:hypothetical protein B0A49_02016 [Cryomyces minteri]|uniref:Xylanolytic transcriptional activator regulatory domain-containing protein n=1 Tax=Cryomyces minteri TaxID=331657 RepID=A0A4U0XL29_9PEZI|nr:hypothetical protein B0A49_02016 [Cryomyces minteri]